jgi:hypothetical protein
MLSLKMQFNIKSGFCPKQNLFSFEKYAEVHMHMNDMMKFPNLKSGMLQLHFGHEATYVIYLPSDQTTPSSWLPIYMGHSPPP